MEDEPSRPINDAPSSSPSPAEANRNDDGISSALEPAVSRSPARQLQAEADSSSGGTLWNSDSNANPCSPAAATVEGNEAAAQSPQQNCADAHPHGLVNDSGPNSSPHRHEGAILTNSSPVDSSSSSSSSSPSQRSGGGGECGEDRVSGLLSSSNSSSSPSSPLAAGTKTTDSSSAVSCSNKTSTINVNLVNEIDRKELKDPSSQDVLVRHNEDGVGVNQEAEEEEDNFE